MTDDIGAFVPGPRVRIEGRAGGPLSGLTFAAKDLFDVAGVPTGGGNPDWPTGRTRCRRGTPGRCRRLLDAGATLIGKTITDEVSLGILGENAFDGTPVNPRAPGRVPGGSSSGSAAAVAAGHLRHRARHRYRRLGARAGELLRPLRHPADAWPASTSPACCRRRRAPTRPAGSRATPRPSPGSRAVMLGEAIPTALPTRLIVAVDAFGFADAGCRPPRLQPMVDAAAAA